MPDETESGGQRVTPGWWHGLTVADVLVETLVAFGITHVFGMVGHSNRGFAHAMRRAGEARSAATGQVRFSSRPRRRAQITRI